MFKTWHNYPLPAATLDIAVRNLKRAAHSRAFPVYGATLWGCQKNLYVMTFSTQANLVTNNGAMSPKWYSCAKPQAWDSASLSPGRTANGTTSSSALADYSGACRSNPCARNLLRGNTIASQPRVGSKLDTPRMKLISSLLTFSRRTPGTYSWSPLSRTAHQYASLQIQGGHPLKNTAKPGS